MTSESGPWILLHATRIADFLFSAQAIISMFAMIKNKKVKLLKETRMSLYQLFLWKEMKIHIQKMPYTRNCNVILTKTEITQGESMGKV